MKEVETQDARIAELEREVAALREALENLNPCEFSGHFRSYGGYCLEHSNWGCTVSAVLAAKHGDST